jgi:hypothetical protein
MYENAGEKLMSVASTVTGIGMFLSVILGIACFFLDGAGFLLGIIVIAVGCMGCWLSNLVIATFAQIAIDVHKLAEGTTAQKETQQKVSQQKVTQQPAAAVPQATATVETQAQAGWVCASCGQKNSWHVYSCQSCGVTKAWSENQKK